MYPDKIITTIETFDSQKGTTYETVELTNDFKNYKDYISYLIRIGSDSTIEELKLFADCGNCDASSWGDNRSLYAVHLLHMSSMVKPLNPKKDWESDSIEPLLKTDYFEGEQTDWQYEHFVLK